MNPVQFELVNYMKTSEFPAPMQHECGGDFSLVEEPGTFLVHNVDVPITQRFWRCANCNEELVTEELADLVEQEAAAAYRKVAKRLGPTEIRAIRENLGLTQDLFERALGLGPKTFVRWESGRVIPGRSMDNLLRGIERDCGLLVFLAGIHGVELPDSCSAGISHIVDSRVWPRRLVARIANAADKQGTDINSYLIMVLTEYLATAERADAAPLEQILRSDYGTNAPEEDWMRDHNEVMREANDGSRDVAA
ncbi:MAG: type II TA system antitoxin MqsA family protein [Longimicrobiales bacterium]